MTIHYLFVVHGIGSQQNGWCNDPENGLTPTLKAAWQRYPSLTDLGKFDERIKIVELNYFDVYDRWIKKWGEMSDALLAGLQAEPTLNNPAIIKTLADWGKQPQDGIDEHNFFYTHILDVLLYRFVELIQGEIKVRVVDQLLQAVLAIPATQDYTINIIAHSLGTSVIHNALEALFTLKPYRDQLPNAFRINVLMQVADASYALASDRAQHYQSIVKPGIDVAAGVCNYQLDISHKLDLVSELMPFDPDKNWPDAQCVLQRRFEKIRPSRIQARDIHSLKHYFSNPTVHQALFQRLFGFDTFSTDETETAWNQYIAATPEGAFAPLKSDIEHLQLVDTTSWLSVLQSWRTFVALVKAL